MLFTKRLKWQKHYKSSLIRLLRKVTYAYNRSYQPVALAPEAIASAFGTRLATMNVSATSLPLPTELAHGCV
jgi:hypothetical protein